MSASIIIGDCLEAMARLPEACVDACVTDPPYHLVSMVKRFGKTSLLDNTITSDRSRRKADGMARLARGFMGKTWDGGDISMSADTWRAVLRVLKPGAHLVAFGGTRTHHRTWCAIEDAGFEVRDTIMWLYGSGFPKSHDAGNGWGTALKPAWEPIILARKPLIGTVAENGEKYGTGAINIDECRVEIGTEVNPSIARRKGAINHLSDRPAAETEAEGRMASRQSPEAYRAERSGESIGRWPANVIHDGSDEVREGFPDVGKSTGGRTVNISKTSEIYGGGKGLGQDLSPDDARGDPGFGDSGSAARFFYCAKASKSDRGDDNKHPTVKPTDLMRYLCRLVTPKNGLILDPFMGSGSTGKAALKEGFNFLGIEKEEPYAEIARRRIGGAVAVHRLLQQAAE